MSGDGDDEVREHGDDAGVKTLVQLLAETMSKDSTRWENEHMGGRSRYMVLQTLATHPECQRKGVGTKLMQWGVQRADQEGLTTWIHASPASYRLYERAGFQEVGRSEYNLDDFATGGKDESKTWGVYAFRYMVRHEMPARR